LLEFNYINNTKYKLKNKTRFINQEANFVDGKEEGKWLTFYPDGNLLSIQHYVNGKLEGEYISYDIYGNFNIKGNFMNDQKHGEWLVEKGNIKEIYTNGVLTATIHLKRLKGEIKKTKN
jgi:antitoxin component YwqK of YwqJK toxin-antitoxin module